MTFVLQSDDMMMSVRLDPKTRKLIDRIARAERVSRSEVVRRGIYLLAERQTDADAIEPFQAIKHLLGRARGGPRNLSERTGIRFRELLSQRKARR
jgi:Arc/MetJ-type ribon-helix-helix transcriptional regulator